MSNSNVNLRSFEKYTSNGYRTRIVNQREIFEWLKEKGPMTESKIFIEIYNFHRGGLYSNKKYAECLRRLLATGKIGRIKNDKNIFEYFTVVEGFNDELVSKEVSVKEVSVKSKIKNFDILQTRNGNVYLACVDKGILINIEKVGFNYIDYLNDDLTHICDDDEDWDIVGIYRGKNNNSFQWMVDFKNRKSEFEIVWKRPDVKVHSYTNEELKAKLGISQSDKLVVVD